MRAVAFSLAAVFIFVLGSQMALIFASHPPRPVVASPCVSSQVVKRQTVETHTIRVPALPYDTAGPWVIERTIAEQRAD